MFCCTKYARRGSRYTKSYFEQTNTIKDNIGFTKRVFSHGLGCLTFILSYIVSWGPVRHEKQQDPLGHFFSTWKVSHIINYYNQSASYAKHVSSSVKFSEFIIQMQAPKMSTAVSGEDSMASKCLAFCQTLAVPSGYQNPTSYPVFLSIRDLTRFSFGNHQVAGNPKHRFFLFPHNGHTWKAENSPHGNFFLH